MVTFIGDPKVRRLEQRKNLHVDQIALDNFLIFDWDYDVC